jgi:subtilisin family serine protease
VRTVRIGVIDSGINPAHRQITSVAGGVGVYVRDGDVATDHDWSDGLGHGTAVAATILGHAPEAELYSIRIFRRRLEAHVKALSYAIEWALDHELDLVNLSLGCASHERRHGGGPTMVAPAGDAYPGSVAVRADPALGVDELRYQDGTFVASSWARPLGELPKERNFHGTSLAVAHVTGMAAVALASGAAPEELESALAARCEKIGP